MVNRGGDREYRAEDLAQMGPLVFYLQLGFQISFGASSVMKDAVEGEDPFVRVGESS